MGSDSDFESYYYNKVLYYNIVYIVGNSGVFLELKKIYQYGAHIREEYQGNR
jgi:hypothetical protein